MALYMSSDGKTPRDLTEQQADESTAVWLGRLALRASLVPAAFSNIADAARMPVHGTREASEPLAQMRAHQAYGQVRAAAHAGNRFLSAVFRLTGA